jgi:ABC-type multidrug transport system ATPase subunit
MEERDTGGLSGGELQRLAVAAALARQPAMLIADEITTMVDQRGRDGLLGVLNGLTERHRMALVHITHYSSEAEMADQFRADGKIYVVVTVIAIVFAGLAIWLFRLDRRIRNMENEHKD